MSISMQRQRECEANNNIMKAGFKGSFMIYKTITQEMDKFNHQDASAVKY